MSCLDSVRLELLSIRSDPCRSVEGFHHILLAFDVRCESRNYRGVENSSVLSAEYMEITR